MNLFEWLIEPFRFGFMQTALIAGVLVGLAVPASAYMSFCGAWRSSGMRWRIPCCPVWSSPT
ncbi:hypothetical protein [Candidatus Flexifilum breve]|uniref:hypothetical protein n=1 Tax=Candidatus Flexifilum breve TaxID=3140694 RepID=UPI0031CC9D1A